MLEDELVKDKIPLWPAIFPNVNGKRYLNISVRGKLKGGHSPDAPLPGSSTVMPLNATIVIKN